MIATVIYTLIWLCVLALVVWLVIWVLGELGLALPAQIIKIIWVIAALIAILIILNAFAGVVPLPGVR